MKGFHRRIGVAFGIACLTVFAGGIHARAAQMPSVNVLISNIRIFIGNSKYHLTDGEGNDLRVFNENGVTYAPIRALGEALGKDVVWDAAESKITLKDTNDAGEFFSWESFQTSKFPLIAAIPEKNIQLYGINPRGVILYNDGVGQPFDWVYLTPRGVLPRMAAGDYNRDGTEEIGVSLYWGSGTGISIEQLHVLEAANDQFGNPYYIDHEFIEDDYTAQLKELLPYTYDPEKGTLTLQTQDQINVFPCEANFEALHYSSIVAFQFDGDSIKAVFPIGLAYKNAVVYDYSIGTLITEVVYRNGTFTLTAPVLDVDYDFFQ